MILKYIKRNKCASNFSSLPEIKQLYPMYTWMSDTFFYHFSSRSRSGIKWVKLRGIKSRSDGEDEAYGCFTIACCAHGSTCANKSKGLAINKYVLRWPRLSVVQVIAAHPSRIKRGCACLPLLLGHSSGYGGGDDNWPRWDDGDYCRPHICTYSSAGLYNCRKEQSVVMGHFTPACTVLLLLAAVEWEMISFY